MRTIDEAKLARCVIYGCSFVAIFKTRHYSYSTNIFIHIQGFYVHIQGFYAHIQGFYVHIQGMYLHIQEVIFTFNQNFFQPNLVCKFALFARFGFNLVCFFQPNSPLSLSFSQSLYLFFILTGQAHTKSL